MVLDVSCGRSRGEEGMEKDVDVDGLGREERRELHGGRSSESEESLDANVKARRPRG